MNRALAAVGNEELARLARVAERLLAGRPLAAPGNRPRRRRPGQGSEFLDYRTYRTGDDVRAIDWRASARSRDPQVRRRVEESRSDWYVCLDVSASMAVDPEVGALARQLAAAWCFVLLHLGHRTSLLLFSDRIRARLSAGRGHAHYARTSRLLEQTMDDTAGRGSRPSVCAAALPSRCPAIIISDCLAPDAMRSELAALNARLGEMHVMHVRGRLTRGPATGNALLTDAENGAARAVPSIEALLAGANDRCDALGLQLARWCRDAGMAHTRCDTGRRWSRLLTDHLMSLVPGGR